MSSQDLRGTFRSCEQYHADGTTHWHPIRGTIEAETAQERPADAALRAVRSVIEQMPAWGHTSSSWKGTPEGAALLVRDDVLDVLAAQPSPEPEREQGDG